MSTETGAPHDKGAGGSFEDRLKAARMNQGLDTRPNPTGGQPERGGASPWGIGLRLGVEMVSALVVAIAIGYGLDRVLGTRPVLLLVFVPLGMGAGILNVWRLFGREDRGTSSGGRGT